MTALVVRIMLNTSERVGNDESGNNGHFGVTQFKPKHVQIEGNRVILEYTGKSGVEHEKEFCDQAAADLIKKLKSRKQSYLFQTEDGFRIRPDRVNRYLNEFDVSSKDIRGFNSNRLMLRKLRQFDKVEEVKDRKKVFNQTLRSVAEKIGHTPATLRKHYLLPEIERKFYKSGNVEGIEID